jgi:hypothetical protein
VTQQNFKQDAREKVGKKFDLKAFQSSLIDLKLARRFVVFSRTTLNYIPTVFDREKVSDKTLETGFVKVFVLSVFSEVDVIKLSDSL